jgi:hypothetical protein
MYRFERRDKKKEAEKKRMKKHGKNLSQTYFDAVNKRVKKYE